MTGPLATFEPLQIFNLNNSDVHDLGPCSLMKITIETGRTHQIRVHAQYCGHPIIGDSKYGDKIANRNFRQLGLKRLFLHAEHLHLPLADPINIHADLSEELKDLLNKLSEIKLSEHA